MFFGLKIYGGFTYTEEVNKTPVGLRPWEFYTKIGLI